MLALCKPFLLASIFLLVGCSSSALLPLCPALSKGKPSTIPGVGRTIVDACKARNISITVLSSSIAEFRGPKKEMQWLQNNYHIMLCDFDQTTTVKDKELYSTCMTNSRHWIQIIQQQDPSTLMQNPNEYYGCCVE